MLYADAFAVCGSADSAGIIGVTVSSCDTDILNEMGDEFVHNRWSDPFAIVEDKERICWYLGIQLLSLAVAT